MIPHQLITAITLLLFGTFEAGAAIAPGDSVRIVRKAEGDVVLLPEVGALIIQDGEGLKVQFVQATQNRRAPYKTVDLRTEDHILLFNGRRVKRIADLRNAYDALAVGGEVKLGLQRGPEMLISSYAKGDPKDLPRMQIRVANDSGENQEVLPAVGVVLTEKEKRVVVQEVLPLETSAIAKRDVRSGDVIVRLNGRDVSSLKQFVEAYDRLEVGSRVEWSTERKGKSITVSFAKPKPAGPVMIRREAP
jgi:S1-C subfamily serine protease